MTRKPSHLSTAQQAAQTYMSTIDHLNARIRELEAASTDGEGCADDLRAMGLSVAVHNDYRFNGNFHTFWLFTRADGMSFKGEARTDREALNQVRALISPAHASKGPTEAGNKP